jgi:hypothetical protein
MVTYQIIMDSNSPLFDKIRIKKPGAKKAGEPEEVGTCEFPGCTKPGPHKAPKGRGQEGKFWRFCLQHVKEYNHSYNYFNGMADDSVAAFQKDAIIGHRPTWSMGVNPASTVSAANNGKPAPKRDWDYADPLGVLRAEGLGQTRRAKPEPKKPRHPAAVRKALDTLGLGDEADAATIKAQYKSLVKRFHPDAHGGDRSFEARLRDIIRAHDILKTAGLC